MPKKLADMTLEELWRLFPITLSAPQDCWRDWYKEEKKLLRALWPAEDIVISHIGSTAIAGIWAKPIVDILVEIPPSKTLAECGEKLAKNGYICMAKTETRQSFNKGYTEQGFAEVVFHLHMRYAGDNDELYFRDYLNEHPEVAKAYEKLKLSLWKKYEYNRDAYTEAKHEFVAKYTKCAKALYGKRYSRI